MLQILVLKGVKRKKKKCCVRFNENSPKTGIRISRLRRILGLRWDTVLKSVRIRQTDRTLQPNSSYNNTVCYCRLCFVFRHKKPS
jgi:hypothetical protein